MADLPLVMVSSTDCFRRQLNKRSNTATMLHCVTNCRYMFWRPRTHHHVTLASLLAGVQRSMLPPLAVRSENGYCANVPANAVETGLPQSSQEWLKFKSSRFVEVGVKEKAVVVGHGERQGASRLAAENGGGKAGERKIHARRQLYLRLIPDPMVRRSCYVEDVARLSLRSRCRCNP